MSLQLQPKLSIDDSIIDGHDSHKLSTENISPSQRLESLAEGMIKTVSASCYRVSHETNGLIDQLDAQASKTC